MTVKSFGMVDQKLAEADFFFEKVNNCNFEEIDFYFSAFLSAARSITFSLQVVMKDIEGFNIWYDEKRKTLDNQTSRRLKKFRDITIHVGKRFVVTDSVAAEGLIPEQIWVDFAKRVHNDSDLFSRNEVVKLAREHMGILVTMIKDCYIDFGVIIDPEQYYTLENMKELGLTFEELLDDLLGEIHFSGGWAEYINISGITEPEKFSLMQRYIPKSGIKHLFEKYSS